MLILIFSFILGWLITTYSVKLIRLILSKFVNPIPYQLFILSLFIVGSFWLYLISLIPNEFISDFPTVYAEDEPNESKPNPFKLNINSPYFGQTLSLDLRSLSDIMALSVIGKLTLSTIKSSPAPIKILTGAITMGGLSGTYLGAKYLNQIEDRVHTFTTSKDRITYQTSRKIPNINSNLSNNNGESGSNNFKPSSPFEDSEILDYTLIILNCTKIVLFLTIVCFILYCLFQYVSSNYPKLINKFSNKYIIKLINLMTKSAKVYSLF